ncbi:hypothetical protein GLAREA_07415 [Glarea lozoyensis ATCC 20868]|uniref:Amidoligase enzyme n=2 Tax=Glarea lozoyensis TaxID=101852 RepID=S3D196_GLAL2|nr:uncharacterized protein GLAREA_07415 [Glarea lozoyensis ATCC 20868]EHK96838.1 hypothetical protein M7I_7463 [Glarea lozoyensis 74030]EPE32282.1 hypothetical protein GLAREA_07415 [Glarea lozoyensis ATCC 20868]
MPKIKHTALELAAVKAAEKANVKEALEKQVDGEKKQPLTFGLEFKFVLKVDGNELRDGESGFLILKHNTQEARDTVREYIRHVILSAAKREPHVVGYHKLYGIEIGTWNVTDDVEIQSRVCENKFSGSKRYSVELVSPESRFDENRYKQIREVCEAVVSKCRIEINLTCNLHVHIGNNDNISLNYSVLQKLSAILWTFGPHIKRLHQKLPSKEAWRCIPFGRDDAVPEYAQDPTKGLEAILQCNDMDDLDRIVRIKEERCAYSTFKMFQELPGTKDDSSGIQYDENYEQLDPGKTFEFRQHSATFDHQEVLNWLFVCADLVRLAQAMDLKVLGNLLRTWIKVPVGKDLFILVRIVRKVLHLPEVANYYAVKGKVVDEGDELEQIDRGWQ